MRQEKVFAIRFSRLYPMYVAKAGSKGRTRAEVDEVIRWLTGYDADGLRARIESDDDLETSPRRRRSIRMRHSSRAWCAACASRTSNTR